MSSQPTITQPLISTKTAMFTKKNALILLAVVVVLTLCGGLYYWKYVRTSEGYDTVPDDDKPFLKLYYATWCGWSQKFVPVWEELKESDITSKVNLEGVECDDESNKDKCEAANIEGFPSMKLYKNSSDKVGEDYEGERTVEAITAWVNSKL
jgi:thiol-disulfide isomerase/thioredoxin